MHFIDDRAIDTMAMVTDRLREVRNPLAERASALRQLLTAHSGLTHAQVHAVGSRLNQQPEQTMTEEFGKLAESMRPDVHSYVETGAYPPFPPAILEPWPYHHLSDFVFKLECNYPFVVRSEIWAVVAAANDVDEHYAFLIGDVNHKQLEPLRLRVSDAYPVMSAACTNRIDGWVRRALDNLLADLYAKLREALESQGIWQADDSAPNQ